MKEGTGRPERTPECLVCQRGREMSDLGSPSSESNQSSPRRAGAGVRVACAATEVRHSVAQTDADRHTEQREERQSKDPLTLGMDTARGNPMKRKLLNNEVLECACSFLSNKCARILKINPSSPSLLPLSWDLLSNSPCTLAPCWVGNSASFVMFRRQ